MSDTEKPQKPEEQHRPEEQMNVMRRIILQWIGEGKTSTSRAPHPSPSASHKVTTKSTPVADNHPAPHAEQLLLAESHELLLSSGKQNVNLWVWAYRGLWAILLGAMLTLALAVYILHWSGPLTQRFLSYIPLPYAIVEYHPIWYGSFFREYQSLEKFRQQQSPSQPPLQPKDVSTILIRRTIANDIAWSLGLWVSQQEVDEAFNKIVSDAGSIERVQATLQNLWGMTPKDYEQRVLRPYLTKQKLLKELMTDPVISRKLGGGQDLTYLDRYLDTLQGTMHIWVFGVN